MLRRTPLKRTRPKPWFRAEEDKVSPELHAYILKRDGGCIAPRYGATTPCWGRITEDHVKTELRAGKRATSDPKHLVAVCQGHSEDGRKAGYQWNTANREAEREHLRRVEG
jgi:hypothetical protein